MQMTHHITKQAMTKAAIQKAIDKAQEIRKQQRDLEERVETSGYYAGIEDDSQKADKLLDKYETIYQRLVKDAAKNGWSIEGFETDDCSGFETFDTDRDRHKNTHNHQK